MTTEEIISKYTERNIKGVIQLQPVLQDYILFIRATIFKERITVAIAHSMIPQMKLFCEMNVIILYWGKINKLVL